MSENVMETIDGTEVLESVSDTESVMETTEMVEVDSDPNGSEDTLGQIAGDVRVILVIVLLTFCMSCMRGWRRNTLKNV